MHLSEPDSKLTNYEDLGTLDFCSTCMLQLWTLFEAPFLRILVLQQVSSLHICGGDGIPSTFILEVQMSPIASAWCH